MNKIDTPTQRDIKTANREKIFRLFMSRRELTKQDVSKRTGISIPTVTNNINKLLEARILEEVGISASTGGRRPAVIRFIPNAKYSFGVDISPEKTRIILTDLDSQIISETCFNNNAFKNMNQIVQHIKKKFKSILTAKDIPPDRILGAGISLYGTVNEEKMILELAPNQGFHAKNLNFRKYIKTLGFPVYIENDANVSALAEYSLSRSKANMMQELIFISIGSGIGCGILMNGQLYKGVNKRSGEFGHMTIAENKIKCSCGGMDCWELYASEKALLKNYNKRTGRRLKNIEKFFLLVRNDDTDALTTWNTYLDYLAVGLNNILKMLDPGCIVLGGRISRQEDLFREPLLERIFAQNKFYDRDDVTIKASALKENASILGASLLPLQNIIFAGKGQLT